MRLSVGDQWRAAQLGGAQRLRTPEEARTVFEATFLTGSARIDASRFFWAAYYGRPMPALDGPIK